LKGTTINGPLYLNSLTTCDKDKLKSNVKQLKVGYNKKKGNCFFDGLLSKVLHFSNKMGYNIYKTPFGFIVQKGKKTAHGNTIKKAIEDLEFKVISEKLKKAPIKDDTIIDIKYYRLITGACEQGVLSFISSNGLKKDKYKAKDLLPILEKANAYGLDKFKSLITW
jgi:hypothetical protein